MFQKTQNAKSQLVLVCFYSFGVQINSIICARGWKVDFLFGNRVILTAIFYFRFHNFDFDLTSSSLPARFGCAALTGLVTA